MFKLFNFSKIWDWITGKEPEGTPCRVLAKSEDKVLILPGRVLQRKGAGVKICYAWIDEKGHDFLIDKIGFIGLNQGLPLYPHNVGEVYQTTTKALITSDYWNEINNSHVGSQITTDTQELREGGWNIPWKKVIIGVCVLILVYVLWTNGTIPDLLQDIIPNVQKTVPEIVPDVVPQVVPQIKPDLIPSEIP